MLFLIGEGALLLVDYREGSHDLVLPLQRMGLEVEETTLEFGDVSFIGRGNKGKAVSVGIEFKKLGEYVASLRSNRLCGHQLIGMRDAYDYSWLLIEGELLYDAKGGLQRRAGKRKLKPLPGSMGISEYLKRTIVGHLCGGLNPWFSQNRADSLQFIQALYRTWTDVDLDKHRSHLAIYQAPTLIPVSKTREAFNAWDHIGYAVSKAVEDKFGSVRAAANASAEEWAALTTTDKNGNKRKLGMKDALKITTFLDGK
jgi:ERCC4-type nuclease